MAFALRYLIAVGRAFGVGMHGARSRGKHGKVNRSVWTGFPSACERSGWWLLLRASMMVFAAVFAGFAQAQPGGTERTFTVLAGGEAKWDGVSYQAGGTQATALTFSYQRRSEPQKAGGSTLVFTREKTDPATGKPVPVKVAAVVWPAGVRAALLVFVPRPAPAADGVEFDVLAIDDGVEAFPAETVRVLNLTPVVLVGRIGDREAAFGAGLSPVIRMADVVPEHAVSVALALGARTGEGMLTRYLGPLEARPQARSLVVVLPPKVAGSRKVRVNVIMQTLVAPKAK